MHQRIRSANATRFPKTAPDALLSGGVRLCFVLHQWSDLRVTARPSYCGVCASFDNNEPAVIVQKTSGALTKGCTALMGPSGSGKTTLLHAVTGLPTTGLTTRGTVTLDGIAVDQLPRGTISLVPQDAVLPEELSAREYAATHEIATWHCMTASRTKPALTLCAQGT